ncbi:MAG TPA: hypothetical protein VG604_04775 [Candidatus Saccharimonadales bacterium]|nr:hypothetical protein [Candidatus Saccharimonadales bacterium]
MVERPPMVGVVRLVEYDEGLDPRIELSKPYSLDLRIPNSELRFENRVPDDLIDDAVAESLIGRGLEIVRQALGHSL